MSLEGVALWRLISPSGCMKVAIRVVVEGLVHCILAQLRVYKGTRSNEPQLMMEA